MISLGFETNDPCRSVARQHEVFLNLVKEPWDAFDDGGGSVFDGKGFGGVKDVKSFKEARGPP
jgi:hypothetical protein